MLKGKMIKINIMIGIVIVISIFLFRMVNRNVLDVNVRSVKIEKSVSWNDGVLNEQQKNTIKNSPDNYRYLDYMLEVKNTSDKVRISNLYIQPEFFGNMKDIVFWFDSTDEVEDDVRVYPNGIRKCGRRIIIESNGLSDEELIKMAKNVKFKLTYNTFNGSSILSFLSYDHNSQVFQYKEK